MGVQYVKIHGGRTLAEDESAMNALILPGHFRDPNGDPLEYRCEGQDHIFEWHLVVFPMLALYLTLQLTVFIGEAVREAFDPRVFSRLR